MRVPEGNQWGRESSQGGFQVQRTERVVVGAAPPQPRRPVAPAQSPVNVSDLAERVYRLMLDDLALRRERA
jgi:hypothetical protein